MMVGSLVLFWVGQWVMPNENRKEESTFHVLEAEWVQILPDGKKFFLSMAKKSCIIDTNCLGEHCSSAG